MAIGPPSASPSNAGRSEPAASSTTRASSIHCSSVGSAPSGTGSDTPAPRLSKQITRANRPSLRRNRAMEGCSHMTSMLLAQFPMNSTSNAPWPKTW
jgi:hypothetical protein